MGKLLIYMNVSDLKPVGGPAGYLYNLYNQLEKFENHEIEFIKEVTVKSRFYKYYEKLPGNIKKVYQSIIRRKNCRDLVSERNRYSTIDFSKYDMIHFHSTKDMYNVKDSLSNYRGKVILTSHTPKPAFLEYKEDILSGADRNALGEIVNKLVDIDIYAFNRADYIVFPCHEAEEPYYNNWSIYNDIHLNNKHKYKYLLTGIQQCNPRLNRKEVCEIYKIPEDAFIVSFVGRHNKTKGYDSLKLIGEELLKQKKNVYFLIAGQESPLKGLDNDRWIEVGWTNDPHSLISASDIFVLPNKETYFDLVMLEALSLGVPVLASKTGGNRYFNKYDDTGIFLYEGIEEAVQKLLFLSGETEDKLNQLRNKNKILFNQNFTAEIFTNNYIHLINDLRKK